MWRRIPKVPLKGKHRRSFRNCFHMFHNPYKHWSKCFHAIFHGSSTHRKLRALRAHWGEKRLLRADHDRRGTDQNRTIMRAARASWGWFC